MILIRTLIIFSGQWKDYVVVGRERSLNRFHGLSRLKQVAGIKEIIRLSLYDALIRVGGEMFKQFENDFFFLRQTKFFGHLFRGKALTGIVL